MVEWDRIVVTTITKRNHLHRIVYEVCHVRVLTEISQNMFYIFSRLVNIADENTLLRYSITFAFSQLQMINLGLNEKSMSYKIKINQNNLFQN